MSDVMFFVRSFIRDLQIEWVAFWCQSSAKVTRTDICVQVICLCWHCLILPFLLITELERETCKNYRRIDGAPGSVSSLSASRRCFSLLSSHPIITTVSLLCLPSEQKAVTLHPELVGRSMCSTHTHQDISCVISRIWSFSFNGVWILWAWDKQE